MYKWYRMPCEAESTPIQVECPYLTPEHHVLIPQLHCSARLAIPAQRLRPDFSLLPSPQNVPHDLDISGKCKFIWGPLGCMRGRRKKKSAVRRDEGCGSYPNHGGLYVARTLQIRTLSVKRAVAGWLHVNDNPCTDMTCPCSV